MIVHSWMRGIFLPILSQYLPDCRLTGKKKMGVHFFLSVLLLLLLCQHGFGFRFRSTEDLGAGIEFNCSSFEGLLPCEEGE
jgi:hypothetical protein